MRRLLVFAVAMISCAPARADLVITKAVPTVRQETLVWCWLAVSEMIIRYYNFEDTPPRQCMLVAYSSRLPQSICCASKGSCVRTGGIQEIVSIIRHYTGFTPTVTGPPARPSYVARALKKNKLIVAAMMHPNGSGHVVVVRGIRRNDAGVQLLINDPMSRIPQTISFDQFRQNWTQSLIVQFQNDSENNDPDDDAEDRDD